MDKKSIRNPEGEGLSISDMMQAHPFEYLSKLNSINSYCNNIDANHASYSCISRVKLPWKSFSIIKIPQHFKNDFKGQLKGEFSRGNYESSAMMDEQERRFWKEHEELIQKYEQQRQKSKLGPSTAKSENKEYTDKVLARDRNNIFLKKILEKGSRFLYDEQELRKEVLGKLRKVRGEVEQNPSNLFSVEKKLSTIKRKKGSDKSKTANSVDKYRPRPRTSINKEEFLSFEKGKEVVERYRRKIREIDCSLPQNHIKKTISLLRNMENIVERLTS